MSLFFETIKIYNGKRYNLSCHNQRMNKCRSEIFKSNKKIDLKKVIKVPQKFSRGNVKCKVLYEKEVVQIEFEDYFFKNPRRFMIVKDDNIEYPYKSIDRSDLNSLFSKRGTSDDIIIIKNGLITDSSYANLALFKDGSWYTPDSPLLSGTQRDILIKKGKLKPINIEIENLKNFKLLKIINAMTGWGLHKPVRINPENIIGL